MSSRHMVKYHVLIPLGLFLLLVVVGVPFGTALVIGMMTGCMSMMVMMMGHGSRGGHDRDSEEPHSRF